MKPSPGLVEASNRRVAAALRKASNEWARVPMTEHVLACSLAQLLRALADELEAGTEQENANDG